MFNKATRSQSKLRLCISGISGSGKTMAALTLADTIKGEQRVAVIDTENGSASLYADRFDFDVLNLDPPFSPARFVEAISRAEKEGYSVIVIDSATHEWDGSGGCLELNQHLADTIFKGNTWAAWNETNKLHKDFIDAIVQSKAHVICTVRSKTETAQEGKKIMRLGTKLVQRDNFEYEFTLALDLTHDGHYASALKDRTGLFSSVQTEPVSKDTGVRILEWLNDGQSQKEIVDSYLKDIKSCESLEKLKDVFTAAHKSVNRFGDMDFMQDIITAKDETKLKLEPQPEEAA